MSSISPVAFIVMGVVILLELYWAVKTYNRLQRYLQTCQEAYSNLLATLETRYMTIGSMNIASAAFMNFEKNMQIHLANLKSESLMTKNTANDSAGTLEASVKTIVGSINDVPELKGGDVAARLFEVLRLTEDNVLGARLQYNRSVAHFLDVYQKVPHRYLARALGFVIPQFFAAEIVHTEQDSVMSSSEQKAKKSV